MALAPEEPVNFSRTLTVPEPVPVRLSPREHLNQLWLPWQEAAEKCFSWSNAAAIRRLGETTGTSIK